MWRCSHGNDKSWCIEKEQKHGWFCMLSISRQTSMAVGSKGVIGMDGSVETAVYEIRIQGHLSSQRAQQFEEMIITHLPGGTTLMVGVVVDRAALCGLLSRVCDLGVTLISVLRLDVGKENN